VRQLVEDVINQGRLAVVDDLFTADYIEHQTHERQGAGREGVKHLIGAFRVVFPDLHATLDHLIIDGDQAAFRLLHRGTHHGELAGVPPTGKAVTFVSFDICRFRDGRIAEHWGLEDMFGILQQLGVTISLPEAAPPASRATQRAPDR
jgi:predicted ester cyclase